MKRTIFILGIIFILGLFLRFLWLGEVPVGFHRDEAFLGYNAYSILETGRDINGNFLPLHLESFLYSPAGYSYFSIPFIKIFDLSAFSVRFASALFGSLTILITYFLAKIIFSGGVVKRLPRGESWSEAIALLSAFLLAISSWHINLSRTATENTVVVFLITLGTLLFLIGVKRNKFLFILGAFILFALTLFTYQAARAFLPFFVPLLMLLFLKRSIRNNKLILTTVLFSIFIITPIFLILSSKELSLRIRTVSIFATAESQLVIDEQLREDGVSNVRRFLTRTFHNKPLSYSSQVLQNYFKHFSYDFLFTDKGFPDRYRIPLTGLLLIFELPLLVFGVWSLLQMRNSAGVFLIGWLLLAPLGSALTFDDVPNLQRMLIGFPALSIVEGVGLVFLISLLKEKRLFLLILIAGVLVAMYSLAFYLHQYYVHGPRYRPWYVQEGYKEVVSKINQYSINYDKIVITNHESAPAIFFLFFSKYSPHLFQQETRGSLLRDFDRIGFDKYEFSQEECPLNEINSTEKKNILYVNFGACKVPNDIQILDEVRRSDSSLVFRLLVFP